MFLIDTCVWLDLAKDPHQDVQLAFLEALITEGRVGLLLPRIVVTEFERNREKVVKESTQSLRGVMKRVKEAIQTFGDPSTRDLVFKHLDDVNQRMPLKGGAAVETLERISRIFERSTIIEASDDVMVRAAHRAIECKAPFHRNINSMGDAIIVETYSQALRRRGRGLRFALITHNTKDFSCPGSDLRIPHPDLAPLFSKLRSLYFTRLVDALRRAEPGLMDEVMFEHSYEQEPRGLNEILQSLDLLFHQVWYNRHQNTKIGIARGDIKIVEKEEFPVKDHSRRPIQKDTWAAARKAAKRVEKEHGKKNLGPWDDFEWGMVNGKLSALRWVLGEEWDFLDT